MRYLVYGAGAIGGVIGGRLHRAGLPVTLVARGDHLRVLQEQGLTLDAPDEVATLSIPAVGSAAEVDWGEDTVVLLCVKSQQTAAALDDLSEHAPGATAIVSAQNGVANEPAILRRFSATYAICVMLPATHLEPGVVVQRGANAPGILDVGRFPAGADETAAAIATDLRTAGFASEPTDDIMAWKYRKLMRNLRNGVDAIATVGPAADELARRAIAEGESVIATTGIEMRTNAEYAARRSDLIRERPDRPSGSSTSQSVRRGSGVEIDYLSGEIMLLGRLHGVPTPVNELIWATVHDVVRRGLPARSLDATDLLAQLPE